MTSPMDTSASRRQPRSSPRRYGRFRDFPPVEVEVDGVEPHLCGLAVAVEDVAAEVILARLAHLGVASIQADVDLAAGADVIARVELRLRREPLGVGADDLVDVRDHPHAGGLGVE